MEEITLNEEEEDSPELINHNTKNENEALGELKVEKENEGKADEEKETSDQSDDLPETIKESELKGENIDIVEDEKSSEKLEIENDKNLMESLLEKLQKLELQNAEFLNEVDNQKKVIEMLRCEVTKKDDELMALENTHQSTKQTLEAKYNSLNEESSRKIAELKRKFDAANKDKESMAKVSNVYRPES